MWGQGPLTAPAPADDDPFAALALLQARLARRLDVHPAPAPLLAAGARLLALDVQYEGDVAFAAGALCASDGRLVAGVVGRRAAPVPYRSGLFCFREGPPLAALIAAAAASGLTADLLLVDGHGLAHPRRFGAACWLGLATGLRTVGCAKQALIRSRWPAPGARQAAPVEVDGRVVGYTVRRHARIKPVYASPGHGCSPEQARDLVLALPGAHRVPDPLRAADQAARRAARGEAPAPGWRDLGELPEGPAPAE